MTPPAVVTLGEALLRLSPPEEGRLEQADLLRVHAAGAEVNVAVALGRLGVDVAWVTALPDSPLGRRVAAEVGSAGVDLDFVSWVPDARMGLFFVEFGATPRPTAVWYDRARSAFSQLADFEARVLDHARHAVISGVTPALGPNSLALAERFIAEARTRDVSVCLDVNYRAKLWSEADACETLAPLLAQANIAVCSERDARDVFECDGTDAALLANLRARWAPRAEAVVMTQSGQGAIASTVDGSVVRQPAFATSVVDRFGAGDAFVAGLLWGLLKGDISGALRSAAALAALKCTVHGDFALFGPEEVASVIASPEGRLVR